MMNSLISWDTKLFLWLNNLGVESWDGFWLQVSEMATWIPLYAVLLFLLFRGLGLKSGLIAMVLVILNVFLTDQGSTWFFKEQFHRLRPCHVEELQAQMRLVKDGCGGLYGFLSAHSANTFGMAFLVGSTLRFKYRWLFPVLFIWAAFVAYSRIYIGVHYPLDIIAGALYGILCGYLMYSLFLRLTKNRNVETD